MKLAGSYRQGNGVKLETHTVTFDRRSLEKT